MDPLKSNTQILSNPRHGPSQTLQDGLDFKDESVPRLRQSLYYSSVIYELLALTKLLDLSYKMGLEVAFPQVVVRIQ